jgi:hypothetical protein
MKFFDAHGDVAYLNESYIYMQYERLLQLGRGIEGVKDMIERLNKRQKNLGVEQTDFPIAYKLETSVNPFKMLWEVAHQFVRRKDDYWNSRLIQLEPDKLKEQLARWYKSLHQLKRMAQIQSNEGPKKLRQAVSLELDGLKEHLPLVTSLMSKGLERKHYQEMSDKLGIDVDPAHVTLNRLKAHEGLSLQAILEAVREVSAQAFRENAMRIAIEGIEKALIDTSFAAEPYKDTDIRVVCAHERVLQAFEELNLKLQSVKGNSLAHHHAERIERADRELYH